MECPITVFLLVSKYPFQDVTRIYRLGSRAKANYIPKTNVKIVTVIIIMFTYLDSLTIISHSSFPSMRARLPPSSQ
jgi:hypothetical protein